MLENLEVDEAGKVLVTESNLGKLYVYFEEYNGVNMLHIRYWYKDKKQGGIWRPGSKGIAIPEANVKKVLAALKIKLAPQAVAPPIFGKDTASPYGG